MLDPYAPGVLQKEHHDRLVADLDNFAKDAGIQPHWICEPLPGTFTAGEKDYLKRFRQHMTSGSISGVAYVGKGKSAEIDQRMSAFAGCLVRNFVRARVMTLGAVLDAMSSRSMPELSCLLIPNFFLSASEGGTIASWQVSALHELLMSRQVSGLQTIVYVSDMSLLAKEYGLAFRNLIEAHFVQVSA